MASPSYTNTALDSERSYNSAPCQEYFLQGSILSDHIEELLSLLKAVCDDFEEPVHSFKDYEMCYESDIYDENGRPLQLRVRRSLIHRDMCTVRYVGRTEQGDASQPTAMRTIIEVLVSGDIEQFLACSGFEKIYDYYASGYIFRKGRMNVVVSRIVNPICRGLPPLSFFTQSCLVEMSVVERPGRPAAGVEMRRFADSLRPIIELFKPEDIFYK